VDTESGRTGSWPLAKFIPEVEEDDDAEGMPDPLTPQRLAWAGFYYAPEADSEERCVCFCCGATKSDWETFDDPIYAHAPECLFKICAMARIKRRILPVPPPTEAQKKRTPGRTWRTKCDPALEKSLASGAIMAKASDLDVAAANKEYHKRRTTEAQHNLQYLEEESQSGVQVLGAPLSDLSSQVSENAMAAFLSVFDGDEFVEPTPLKPLHKELVNTLLRTENKAIRHESSRLLVNVTRTGDSSVWTETKTRFQKLKNFQRRKELLSSIACAAATEFKNLT